MTQTRNLFPINKDEKMSFTGNLEESYVVTTPRELLFDGDWPPFYEHPATSLEDAREKASKLTDAKILLTERVTIEGFSGTVSRSREVE